MTEDKYFDLKIDDQKQTVQGVNIPSYYDYVLIRETVKISCMEGWQPTAHDIQELFRVATMPQPELEKDFQDIFGEDSEIF